MRTPSGRSRCSVCAWALLCGLAGSAWAQVSTFPAANPAAAGVHYLGPAQRQAIKAYYEPMIRAGNCPPGIPRGPQGCLSPQQRVWRIGARLPMGLISYPVPLVLRARLEPLPAGANVIRVGGDILVIANGGIVVDAAENLAF